MERLSKNELLKVFNFIEILNSESNITDPLPPSIVNSIIELIPCDHVLYMELDESNKLINIISKPEHPVLTQDELHNFLTRNLQEHPCYDDRTNHLITPVTKFSAMSDTLTQHQYSFYKTLFSALGMHYSMCGCIPKNGSSNTLLSLSRKNNDFSKEEEFLFSLIIPQITQRLIFANTQLEYTQLQQSIQHISELEKVGIIYINKDGSLQWSCKQANKLLSDYFEGSNIPQHFPETIANWLEKQRKNHAGNRECEDFIISTHEKELHIKYVVSDKKQMIELLYLSENKINIHNYINDKFNLSNREAEILNWVTEGKSNAEVAMILSIKPATVKKHLENIYNKIGVGNRMAAVKAWQSYIN